MPSTKKLTTYRSTQFSGPRRKKPPVRTLNRMIAERIGWEKELVQRLIKDADTRRAIIRGMQLPCVPFGVWNDFDQNSTYLTELAPGDLPKWEDIGQFLKFHLLFQVALEECGYSFTVRVRPDLEEKWNADGRDPMDRITREARKALEAQGLRDLEYCYVVETRTKRGSARTGMHLHGFLANGNPMVATRFKVAMEAALSAHPKGRVAAGFKAKSGPPVEVELAYDLDDQSKHGRGRWASYMAKNATRWDARFKRRTFMSQSATQTAREFWKLLREEPL